MGWPANMIEKKLQDGSVAYYWNPHVRYMRAGFTLHREALGLHYADAIARATELNRHLDDWRRGCDTVKDVDLQPGYGTLEWLVERYKRSNAWEKRSPSARATNTSGLSIWCSAIACRTVPSWAALTSRPSRHMEWTSSIRICRRASASNGDCDSPICA
jgi:hypothetical protein